MKSIEPGCLVMLVKAARGYEYALGKVLTVVGFARTGYPPCVFCGNVSHWPLDDGMAACRCNLIRLDDDPDSVTEPTEHEVEA